MRTAERQQVQLSGKQFTFLMSQLQTRAGIRIESPLGVIEGCVGERLEHLGLDSTEDYLTLFDDSISARAEWLALVDLLTVKETRFFRQPAALEAIADHARQCLSQGVGGDGFSFWSAGCSAGQELYSIAMVLEDCLQRHDPWIEWHGIGTDISFRAITEAQQGRYREAAIQRIPLQYRRAFTRATGADEYAIDEALRARCHFFHSNLLHVNSAPFADFNAISCQNVLIYFDTETQHWIMDQLVERLRDGGLLVLGAGEDVGWNNPRMQRANLPGVSAYNKLEV